MKDVYFALAAIFYGIFVVQLIASWFLGDLYIDADADFDVGGLVSKIKTAEADGHKKYLLADAEGKRASLTAEAEKITAIELAPALAVERMVQAGMTPQMIVQYKTVDQLKGIAEASAEMFEHLHLGQVTVYGNENTAGNFMAKTAESLNPALELLKNIPFKKTFMEMFGKEKREELPVATEVIEDSKDSSKEDEFPSVE